MQVIRELSDKPGERCVIALGNFDGVHLGHRSLLESGLEKAHQLGLKLCVLLFEPHPLKIIKPGSTVELLTTLEQRIQLFAESGIEAVYLLPFTQDVAKLTPREFIEEILLKIGVEHVVIGFNYSFGSKGAGTPELLHQLGQRYGFEVSVLQAKAVEGNIVSSTAIRAALQEGNIALAQKMLGRMPSFRGKVVHGEQRGRKLGFPTANLAVEADLIIPKRGVYAVSTIYKDQRLQGVMNIGMKPTFHAEYQMTIEVYFLAYKGDLYGQELEIHIGDRLRDEKKFSGIDELIAQLQRDAEKAKAYFEL